VLSAVLFSIGTAGVFLRRNLITVLLSIEIMAERGSTSRFVAAGRYAGTVDGQIIVFFVMTVAARRGRGRPGAGHRALPAPGNAQAPMPSPC